MRGVGGAGRGVAAKLGDFGLAVKLQPGQECVTGCVQGTLTHMVRDCAGCRGWSHCLRCNLSGANLECLYELWTCSWSCWLMCAESRVVPGLPPQHATKKAIFA